MTEPAWRSQAARRSRYTWSQRADRLHAWRRHPFYANNMKVVFPGLGIGACLFAGFMVAKQFVPGGTSGGHHH